MNSICEYKNIMCIKENDAKEIPKYIERLHIIINRLTKGYMLK